MGALVRQQAGQITVDGRAVAHDECIDRIEGIEVGKSTTADGTVARDRQMNGGHGCIVE